MFSKIAFPLQMISDVGWTASRLQREQAQQGEYLQIPQAQNKSNTHYNIWNKKKLLQGWNA